MASSLVLRCADFGFKASFNSRLEIMTIRRVKSPKKSKPPIRRYGRLMPLELPTIRSNRTCTICYDPAGDGFRPIGCPSSHTVCRSCFLRWTLHISPHMPPKCMVCEHHLRAEQVDFYLSNEQLEMLLKKILRNFLSNQCYNYGMCPVLDCNGFYRKRSQSKKRLLSRWYQLLRVFGQNIETDRESKLTCNACSNALCSSCRVPWHYSESCEQYYFRTASERETIQTDIAGHGAKACPGCNISIQRNGGCLHVTCITCGTHFCWLCLYKAHHKGSIYRHLRKSHPTIGLCDPDEAQQNDNANGDAQAEVQAEDAEPQEPNPERALRIGGFIETPDGHRRLIERFELEFREWLQDNEGTIDAGEIVRFDGRLWRITAGQMHILEGRGAEVERVNDWNTLSIATLAQLQAAPPRRAQELPF